MKIHTRILNLAVLMLFSNVAMISADIDTDPIYLLPSASIEDRVEDLLARMNTKEKLAQISAQWLPEPQEGETPEQSITAEWLAQHLSNGIGTIGPCQLGIDDEINTRNRIKEFLKTKTRLGIPTFFHDEACHGLMKPEATSFPAPIGLACTWNESLIEQLYDMAAREARARGTHHALSPIVDITLDPRWGRTEETLGEDPFLAGRLGTAMVKGLQGSATGEIDDEHIMATLKHLTGHGVAEGGLNRSPVHIGPIELRETHISSFATIIRDAKPAAIMPSYNELDGIPSHANRPMLMDLVRGEFGFEGLYVSDYRGINQLHDSHKIVSTKAEAARLALQSGIQMELPFPETFSHLEPLVAEDPELATLIDEAVRAVLHWKFKMGLFEEPVLDSTLSHVLVTSPESRELALQAARESIVLLKNDGNLLPLTAGEHSRIAVIGPNANAIRLGGYSGRPIHAVSLLEGIKSRLGDQTEVIYAEGCKITAVDTGVSFKNWRDVIEVTKADSEVQSKLIEEAVAVANSADLIILAIGENEVISRESWEPQKQGDRATLELFGAQSELAKRIAETGKPVILYLSNGRPISLGDLADQFPVIIEGWYAGQETGIAAAEILFGDVNPSGKLTISIPLSVGHLPSYYRKKPFSAPYTYLFSTHEAQFPFGFGLSYTDYTYSNLKLSKAVINNGESLKVTVEITNTGKRNGVEIAQLYLRDEVSTVTRPVRELRGFKRVQLKAGESQTVEFELGPDAMAMYRADLKRVVEPGWFRVFVGTSSQASLDARFEVK